MDIMNNYIFSSNTVGEANEVLVRILSGIALHA